MWQQINFSCTDVNIAEMNHILEVKAFVHIHRFKCKYTAIRIVGAEKRNRSGEHKLCYLLNNIFPRIYLYFYLRVGLVNAICEGIANDKYHYIGLVRNIKMYGESSGYEIGSRFRIVLFVLWPAYNVLGNYWPTNMQIDFRRGIYLFGFITLDSQVERKNVGQAQYGSQYIANRRIHHSMLTIYRLAAIFIDLFER